MAFLSSLIVWRPHLPNSIDGQPLTTNISDFWNFPYDRIDMVSSYSRWSQVFMRPEFPLFAVIFYVVFSKPLTKFIMEFCLGKEKNFSKNKIFQKIVFLHNLSLALFSFVVMIHSIPIVLTHYQGNGFMAIYCDLDGKLWRDSNLGAWATIFYISKYYEFIDTWILVLKGKKVSFLQTYHHSGIVLTMYGAVTSHGAWILIVVTLNSFIHTLMYTYFSIKTLWPEKQIKYASLLTKMQIGQFVTGIMYTLYVQVLGNDCDSSASRITLAFIQLYVVGLIFLFMVFAKKKYSKKNDKRE